MKNVEEYTMVELLDKYSKYFYAITDKVFRMFFAPREVNKARNNIRDELSSLKIKPFSPQFQDIERRSMFQLLKECIEQEPELNNDRSKKLVLLSVLYRECLSRMKKSEIDELKKTMLGDKEYAILSYKDDDEVYDYEIVFKGEPERTKSIKDDILRNLIEMSFDVASAEDIGSMIETKMGDKNLFDVVMKKIVIDFFVKEKKMPIEKYYKMLEDEQARNEMSAQFEEEFSNRYKEYFKNHLQLFEKRDLLLNTAARIILGIRKHKGEKLDSINLEVMNASENDKEDEDYSIAILRHISKELEKNKYTDDGFAIVDSNGKEVIYLDRIKLKEFLARCTENGYISDKDIEDIKLDLLKGEFPEDIDVLRIVDFDNSNLIDICKNYEARENDDPLKQKLLECGIKMTYYLLAQEKMTEEKLLDLYVNGLIPFEIINEINFKELEEGTVDKKFKEIYDELLYSSGEDLRENEDINNKLNRFSIVYRKFEEEGLADSNELIEALFNAYGRDNKVEILSDLNDLGIIGIEQCIDKAGIYYLIAKYREGVFIPAQIRQLYDNSKITIDEIGTFIKDISENKKKYMAIGAIFPGEDEEDCIDRDVLVAECINVENGIVTKTGRRNKKADPTFKTDGSITDPFARLELFKELDMDYELDMTGDGHVIVKCPNSKKVIIEKLLDKDGNPYYGAATYVLDEDYYKKNEIYIYTSDMIDRHELSSNAKIKGIDKIPHNKDLWGNRIKEVFGVKMPGKYTEEHISKIDEAIARVERSRKSRSEI